MEKLLNIYLDTTGEKKVTRQKLLNQIELTIAYSQNSHCVTHLGMEIHEERM